MRQTQSGGVVWAMRFHSTRAAAASVVIGLACTSAERDGTTGLTGIGGVDDDDDDDGETDASATESEVTVGSSTSGDDASTPKLDVGAGGSTTNACVEGECEMGCTAVDLLFVIDNSSSMEPYQAALAEAFPAFAATIIDALEPGVNLHVGVTSTEMGFSSSGENITEYLGNEAVSCEATGDGGADSDTFYQTPDSDPTDTNGAQGRLYIADGVPYFDIDTDAPPGRVAELENWFAAAAQIGDYGSNIEMSAAAAGWATDAVNADTNEGFLRDEGAVLVLFFVQDEHDQTPASAAGDMLAKIADSKAACGGFECVVGGGFVNEDCLHLTPLGQLFDALGGKEVVTETLPDPADVTPQTFENTLRDTLAGVIVDTCDQIEPPA